MSRFALLGGGVRVRVGIREQREMKGTTRDYMFALLGGGVRVRVGIREQREILLSLWPSWTSLLYVPNVMAFKCLLCVPCKKPKLRSWKQCPRPPQGRLHQRRT